MELVIGRKGDQPFTITDKSVSGKHLKLTTMPNGNVQVEDLGSNNGTFIDGVRIIKKVVSRNTVVRMGSNYTFCIKDVIPEVKKPSIPKPQTENTIHSAPQPDPEIKKKFKQLEFVWNKYQHDKIKLQKNNVAKNFLRMLPAPILGLIAWPISNLPELASYRIYLILGGLLLGCVISVVFYFISYKSSTSLPEKMEKLNQQFQIDYVCPRCKHFLGFVPYKGLKNLRKCSACKSKWV